MIIDAGLIENGVTPEILSKLIQRHAATVGKYAKLDDDMSRRNAKVLDRAQLNLY